MLTSISGTHAAAAVNAWWLQWNVLHVTGFNFLQNIYSLCISAMISVTISTHVGILLCGMPRLKDVIVVHWFQTHTRD